MLSSALVLAMVAQIAAFISNDYGVFLILLATTILLTSFYLAPTFAAIQSAADPSARSFASAVALFCINGLGIASGAFVVGAISDVLTGWMAAHSLKWALIAVSFVKAWSACHYWMASRNIAA